MAAEARRSSVALAAALLLLPASLAGCTAPNFRVDVGEWRAGFAWEYDEKRRDSVELTGTPPSFMDLEEEAGERLENRTFRLEVFNSTALSVEGLPIYAVGVLSRVHPDENQSITQTDFWDAWVYTKDLNVAQPTFLDWRTEEVQLSSDAPTEEANASREGTEAFPAEENRLLDWPLTRGHRWVHEEDVPGLEGEPGLLHGVVQREATVRVPAGSFRAVRLHALLEPFDTSEVEGRVKEDLEAQGGRVQRLSFQHTVTHDYAYSREVVNFVQQTIQQETAITARGRDGDGNEYDFVFRERAIIERSLARYQVVAGSEKPLSFALDIKRGVYLPRPIIPAAHFAVEIVSNRGAINFAAAESANLAVRIYNSSAGEEPLRGRESEYPKVAAGNPEYDHDLLEVRWSLQTEDLAGRFREYKSFVGDSAVVGAPDLTQAGLKQVQATLKLKDSPRGPGQEIFTDTILFEAFYHANLSFLRAATNVTPNQGITVRFPVEMSWRSVRVNASVQNAPPEAQCAVGGSGDCLRVSDGANKNVQDQRSERMRFEAAPAAGLAPGSWRAEYTPSTPGQTVVFEVQVRYGRPA